MIEARNEPTKAEREAADWYARLLNPPVENEELADFAAWRRDPDNRAAYNRVEDIARLALLLREDPDMRAATAEALNRRPRPAPWYQAFVPTRRQRWIVGVAFAGIASALFTVWKMAEPTYQTPIGGQVSERLADGTQVRLNTDTALKVRFDGGVRRVELQRGQAFFDVAHDPAHPFIVVAGDTQVRAIGTRFDVRREAGAVRVVLTQGKVAVSQKGASGAPVALTPGQSLTTGSTAVPPRPVVVADLAVVTGWTSGHISFRATPLAEAVAEVNRYNRGKIVLGADVPADARVNGDFPVDAPEAFVAAVTTLYGLRSERRLDGATELKGPAE